MRWADRLVNDSPIHSALEIQREADRAACHVVYTLSCIPDVAAIDSLRWLARILEMSYFARRVGREKETEGERERGGEERERATG